MVYTAIPQAGVSSCCFVERELRCALRLLLAPWSRPARVVHPVDVRPRKCFRLLLDSVGTRQHDSIARVKSRCMAQRLDHGLIRSRKRPRRSRHRG